MHEFLIKTRYFAAASETLLCNVFRFSTTAGFTRAILFSVTVFGSGGTFGGNVTVVQLSTHVVPVNKGALCAT